MHKAGFVNIIGRPNVGKSTLMNALLGEKLSITTPKAQTTRHRIIGIMNGDDHQIVFSDTPGIIIDQQNALHKSMMRAVMSSLEDADVICFITDIFEEAKTVSDFLEELNKVKTPKILVINKIDLLKNRSLEDGVKIWEQRKLFDEIIPIAALQSQNVDQLLTVIQRFIPEHPPYYEKEELTDRNTRYFVSEIIREKIFLNYQKEIPYSCEVVVTDYQEDDDIDRIRAEIFVERSSQKNILIGHKGSALKKVGIAARADIEKMVGKQVYLELFVKVKEGWRNDDQMLRRLGYNQ